MNDPMIITRNDRYATHVCGRSCPRHSVKHKTCHGKLGLIIALTVSMHYCPKCSKYFMNWGPLHPEYSTGIVVYSVRKLAVDRLKRGWKYNQVVHWLKEVHKINSSDSTIYSWKGRMLDSGLRTQD